MEISYLVAYKKNHSIWNNCHSFVTVLQETHAFTEDHISTLFLIKRITIIAIDLLWAAIYQ